MIEPKVLSYVITTFNQLYEHYLRFLSNALFFYKV